MKHAKFARRLSLALALLLTAAALPFGALAAENDMVELVATDVTLDETHFEYTGEEIRPNVTVRVQDTLLTLDKDYSLSFRNNVEVGEAAVVVTGIATSGYLGTVEHPFYIDPRTSDEEAPGLITIVGTDRHGRDWELIHIYTNSQDLPAGVVGPVQEFGRELYGTHADYLAAYRTHQLADTLRDNGLDVTVGDLVPDMKSRPGRPVPPPMKKKRRKK